MYGLQDHSYGEVTSASLNNHEKLVESRSL